MGAKDKMYDGLKLTSKPRTLETSAAAAAFIEAGEPPPRSTPRAAVEPVPPQKDPSERVIVYLPRSLEKWLRHHCVDTNRSVSGFVCGLVQKAKDDATQ